MNDITALLKRLVLAAEKGCCQTLLPDDCRALVEALEARDKQIADSESRVSRQNRHVCELFDDNTALRQRIAELEVESKTMLELKQASLADNALLKLELEILESRTVTVNPYPLATDKSQGWTIHPDFLHQIRERIGDDAENYDFSPSMEMVEAVLIAAAGIQVIEGEA